MDETEVGERVAYFRAFVEAVAADDAVWHADRDEAVFEFARLELRADEDRGAVERDALALEAFEFLADPPRFLGPVPHADDAKLVAGIELGPQRLAEAPRVLCDQRRSGSEDLRGRSEEHTSELPSLMRISYAVFCLKKKKK